MRDNTRESDSPLTTLTYRYRRQRRSRSILVLVISKIETRKSPSDHPLTVSSLLVSQRYLKMSSQTSLTDGGLVSLEDIGSGKSVSVLVPNELFEMFLGGLDSSIRFGRLSASGGVGGERGILASSRCGAIGVSKTSDVLVGAERRDAIWSVYVQPFATTSLER